MNFPQKKRKEKNIYLEKQEGGLPESDPCEKATSSSEFTANYLAL